MSTDLTPRRMAGMGWVRDLPDRRDLMLGVEELATPLESVDLESEMPPVYDQLTIGSCVGNGSAAVFDFARHKQGLPFMSPSRLDIYYWCRYLEHTVSSDSGAQVRDALKVLAKRGVPPESEWPYDISKFAVKPPTSVQTDARQHEAIIYKRVPQTKGAIMGVLSSGYPIVLGATLYESFMSSQVAKTGIVPMPRRGESVAGGHCFVLQGYNTKDFPGRTHERNSWSAAWGLRGGFSLEWDYILDPNLSSDLWVVMHTSG